MTSLDRFSLARVAVILPSGKPNGLPGNDSVGPGASDFVRHFTALKNTCDANTAKGAKTAGS
jgi:hypothetical protein